MSNENTWQGAVALVTGANKGIGFEIARGLGRMGITVLLGCRNELLANAAAAQLREEGASVQAIALDVTDPASVASASAAVAAQFGHLDILVNNAGVSLEKGAKPSVVDLALVRRVYDVNVFGVIAVTQAMLPLLKKAPRARIVNVSSSLGSLGLHTRPGTPQNNFLLLGYCSSKSAVNAVTVQFAHELRGTSIKVNAACPGHCATDLNNHTGPRTPAQGAQTPIRLATLPDDGPTEGNFSDEGVVPW